MCQSRQPAPDLMLMTAAKAPMRGGIAPGIIDCVRGRGSPWHAVRVRRVQDRAGSFSFRPNSANKNLVTSRTALRANRANCRSGHRHARSQGIRSRRLSASDQASRKPCTRGPPKPGPDTQHIDANLNLSIERNAFGVRAPLKYPCPQNVSREAFWYDWRQKPYKASDSGPSFDLVRSIGFLVQFQEGCGARLDGPARCGKPSPM
jgi:hypothetical protein